MRKTYFLVLMLMSSVILFVNTSFIVIAEETGLQVTFTTNPTVVAPGTKGFIEVNLKSIGTPSNIEISATSLNPKIIVKNGDWDFSIGYLGSGTSYSVL